jgi:hypothetical protein
MITFDPSKLELETEGRPEDNDEPLTRPPTRETWILV